jgi:Protein of unknown function (DUF4197)
MKKIILALFGILCISSCDLLSNMGVPLTQADIANGIKEALVQGVNRGGEEMFRVQGNGNTSLLNEMLPSEALSLLDVAKNLGFSDKINKVSGTLNQAAINSVQRAVPVFVGGIRQMNITDAIGVLRGGRDAGTQFLRRTTGNQLVMAVQPEVTNVMSSLGLKPTLLGNLGVKNPLLKGLDIDLSGLLTNLIVEKMYARIAQEEVKIRTNISARSTGLLQKVFGSADAQMALR